VQRPVTDALNSRASRVIPCTAHTNSLSGCRILERLSDEGWGDEISSHRQDYLRSIVETEGVRAAQLLTEKGMDAPPENAQSENTFQHGRG